MIIEREAQTPGTAVYSKRVLSIYDLFVLGLSNKYAWRCPSQHILDLYNQHVSRHHLDVGVGTGYFLDKCHFPTPNPSLTLLDLNENSLEVTAQRLARYQPRTIQADVLQPLSLPTTGYDSIGLSYLLHCLPGTVDDKAILFRHLRSCLNPDGVIFGATILGQGVPHNLLARRLMRIYNRRGIFSNYHDDFFGLEYALANHFSEYQIEIIGCVALFAGINE